MVHCLLDGATSSLRQRERLADLQGTEPADLSELLALVAQLKKDKSGLARKVWMLQRLVDAHNYMAMTDEVGTAFPCCRFSTVYTA